MWIHVYPNWKANVNFKSGRERSISNEMKVSISFIPMSRICLLCPIMKWKEIIMWICVCPNWRTNINSTNSRKRSFSYETKASISFMPIKEYVYGAQSWKERRLLYKSMFIPNVEQTLILKMVSEVFLMKPKHQNHLSQ